MRVLGVRDGGIEPGRLVVWRLSGPVHAALDRASPHPAPPSPNQESRLRAAASARSAGQRYARWLAVTTEFDGAVDLTALTGAVVQMVRRHGTLLSGFRVDGGDIRRFVLDGAQVELEPYEIGEAGTRAEILDVLGRLFDRSTDPLAWPSYLFAAVVRPGSTTVVMAFDHINADHYSLAIAVHEIQQLYAALSAGRPLTLPAAGSYVEFCAAESRGLVDDATFRATVREWREYLDDDPALPRLPVDLGLAPGATAPLVYEPIELLDGPTSRAFGRWCRRHGGSFFSGLLASLGRVDHDRVGARRYRALAALQTRPDAAPSLGWYANAGPIRFPVEPAWDLARIIRVAHPAALAARVHSRIPIERIEQELGLSLNATQASWISYIDFRRHPGSVLHEERKVQMLCSERSGRGADLWVYQTWGSTYVTTRYPRTATARAGVHAYVDAVRTAMREACAVGDWRR
jgi:hypothetical protein